MVFLVSDKTSADSNGAPFSLALYISHGLFLHVCWEIDWQSTTHGEKLRVYHLVG